MKDLNDWGLQNDLDGKNGVLAQMEAQQELFERGQQSSNRDNEIANLKSEIEYLDHLAKQRQDLLLETEANLDARITEILEALELVEWIPHPLPNHYYCPWCYGYKHNGHKDFCKRQQALAAAGGERRSKNESE